MRQSRSLLVCHCCGGSGIEPEPLDGAALITTVAATLGLITFTVRQLRRFSEVEDNVRLRNVLAGHSNKAIGKALRRVMGKPIDGLRVDIGHHDGKTAIWVLAELPVS